jgi:sarcosine oxidase subunit beta
MIKPDTRHVVIVGAGVMGLSCAVEMARLPDTEVTVLELSSPGSGSTSRSVGVYTRQYLTRRDIELRARSVESIYELEREGLLLLRRNGFLRLGRDAASTQAFRDAIEVQVELGVTDPGRLIDPDEIAALVPHLNVAGIDSGLWAPTEGYIDGAEFCTALAEKAQSLGAVVLGRTPLLGARRGLDRRFLLETGGGELVADTVVNCAGSWAGLVGDLLDAPVAMANERHEAFTFQLPKDLGYTVPMVIDFVPGAPVTEGLYFRQEGDHQLVAGVHSVTLLGQEPVDPESYFEGATTAGLDTIVPVISKALPDLDLRYVGGWAGIYPYAVGGLPIAGPHPDNPDVLVGAGLHGVGLSLGPAMGRLLAEWLVYGEPRTIVGAEDMVPAGAIG